MDLERRMFVKAGLYEFPGKSYKAKLLDLVIYG